MSQRENMSNLTIEALKDEDCNMVNIVFIKD